MAAIGGALVMFLIGLLNDLMTRPKITQAQGFANVAYMEADAAVAQRLGGGGHGHAPMGADPLVPAQ